jgi:hypothetical protein
VGAEYPRDIGAGSRATPDSLNRFTRIIGSGLPDPPPSMRRAGWGLVAGGGGEHLRCSLARTRELPSTALGLEPGCDLTSV